jgi:hypothetical protein
VILSYKLLEMLHSATEVQWFNLVSESTGINRASYSFFIGRKVREARGFGNWI